METDQMNKSGGLYSAELEMLEKFGADVKDTDVPNALALYRLNKGNKTMYLIETQKAIVEVDDEALANVLFNLYKFAAENLDEAALTALGAEIASKDGDYKTLFARADKYFGEDHSQPETIVKAESSQPSKEEVPGPVSSAQATVEEITPTEKTESSKTETVPVRKWGDKFENGTVGMYKELGFL